MHSTPATKELLRLFPTPVRPQILRAQWQMTRSFPNQGFEDASLAWRSAKVASQISPKKVHPTQLTAGLSPSTS